MKAISASFFHKSITYPVLLNNYLAWGRYFETMKILCFSLKFYPLIWASFCGSVIVITILFWWWLSIFPVLSTFIKWNPFLRISCPLFPSLVYFTEIQCTDAFPPLQQGKLSCEANLEIPVLSTDWPRVLGSDKSSCVLQNFSDVLTNKSWDCSHK